MYGFNDDFDTGVDSEFLIPDSPAELISASYFEDPLISAEIDAMMETAELMGIDPDDPELMGNFLTDLVKKAQSALKKVKNVKLETGAGTTTIGPGGQISYTGTQPAATARATVPQPVKKSGGVADLLKNPAILAAIVGVPLLIILMKKRKGKAAKK